MVRLRAWLRPPRNLLMFFVLVVCLPAAALIALGVRLLDQDRALAHQRQIEFLERAADRGVTVLQQDLRARAADLASLPCTASDVSESAICVVFDTDGFEAIPPSGIPYFPRTRRLDDLPSEPFRELETVEFGEPPNLERALEIGRKLAAAGDVTIRAGALLRQGRILRKLGRTTEALAAFDSLSEISSVAINGEPAELVARRMRCALLEEQSLTQELRLEAERLARDLLNGQWQLDRETYLYVSGRVSAWLGAIDAPTAEQQALAAAAGRLYERWTAGALDASESSGFELVSSEGEPVTIVWTSADDRITAFIAGRQFLDSHWMAELREAVDPAQARLAGIGAAPSADAIAIQRAAAVTGLPWTIVVTAAAGQLEPPEFGERRRNLFVGLALLLLLTGAGCVFIWRAVNRDLAVARLQSEFVSAVSHEFRTPLTALRQFNELLAEDDGPTPEKRHRFYQAQARATERLHRLVESVLDFHRMEAGRHPYRFEALDAARLARDVTAEFLRNTNEAGLAVECHADSGPYLVAADSEALARALWNLLDNAAKYGGGNSHIDVRVSRTNGTVRVGVTDYGIGIPLTEQKSIFQKFVRGAASASHDIKGAGLGLAMVWHIVEAHGGTVELVSTEGAGSTFTLVLPAKERG